MKRVLDSSTSPPEAFTCHTRSRHPGPLLVVASVFQRFGFDHAKEDGRVFEGFESVPWRGQFEQVAGDPVPVVIVGAQPHSAPDHVDGRFARVDRPASRSFAAATS